VSLQLARADLIIHSQREIEVLLSTLKNPPFPLAQSIKLHISALVRIPCLIPCHRCEKYARESLTLTIWSRSVTTSTREPLTCAWIRADIWRQDGAICSKYRKIVPYHRCARIPRLTVSVPDYGSCYSPYFCVFLCRDVVEVHDLAKNKKIIKINQKKTARGYWFSHLDRQAWAVVFFLAGNRGQSRARGQDGLMFLDWLANHNAGFGSSCQFVDLVM